MNKTLFKAITVFLALTVMSSMAFAWDETEHVKLAPNGKGDLIIFPFYFTANGGWETKVTVVNTSDVYSVVAKVIVRSHYYSEELLDFLIYLTPADVWTGTFKNEGQGALISSTDDSMLFSNSVFASSSNPVNKLLYAPTCTANVSDWSNDSNDFGYVEVIESWYGNLNQGVYTTAFATDINDKDWRTSRPVSKPYLKKVYDTWVNAGGPANNAASGSPGQPRLVTGSTSQDQTINVLAAHMQFQNPMVSGMTSGMRASVFADYDCMAALDVANVTGLGATDARNSLGELEAALAKDDLAMEYVNRPDNGELTAHIISFPTKISAKNDQVPTTDNDYCRYINGYIGDGIGFWTDASVPTTNDFATDAYRCLSYTPHIYDLKEQTTVAPGDVFSGGEFDPASTLCEEVNLLVTSGFPALFDEGWVNYDFLYANRDNNNPTDFHPRPFVPNGTRLYHYYGTPAIGTIIKFVNGGLKMFESAHTDGEVYNFDKLSTNPVTGTTTPWYAGPANATDGVLEGWLPDYQYYNEVGDLGQDTW